MSRAVLFPVFSFLVCLTSACLDEPCADPAQCSRPCDGLACATAAPPAALSCPLPGPGGLALNEVLIDPGGQDLNADGVGNPTDDEFIEVVNREKHAVSTTGLELRVDGQTRYSFDGRCLDGGHALVVFGGGQAVPIWAGATGLISATRLSLANEGSTVALWQANAELDSVLTGQVGVGRSLTRAPDGAGGFAVHPPAGPGEAASSPGRCVTLAEFPGCTASGKDDAPTANAVCQDAEYGELVINEILADPTGIDANEDGALHGRHDEFVELMLLSTSPKRLNHVELRIGDTLRSRIWTECLPPGATITVFGGGEPHQFPWVTGPVFLAEHPLGLANQGATVEIWVGEERLDRVQYASAPKGQSLARFPDGVGDIVLHGEIGFGLAASPGACTNGGPSRLDCAVR